MNFLHDLITYIRRLIKTVSGSQITDSLIIDYINRFWINDVNPIIQLFDLKTNYTFITSPAVDRYNTPLYNQQTQDDANYTYSFYPVYQGFLSPCYVNGLVASFTDQREYFDVAYSNYVPTKVVCAYGDGTAGPYTLNVPQLSNLNVNVNTPPSSALVRGHIDISGVISTGSITDPPIGAINGSTIATIPTTSVSSAVYFTSTASDGSNVVIADSGQFLSGNPNFGLLMEPGEAPFGNLPLSGGPAPFYSTTQNTVNYLTGVATGVYFPNAIPSGAPIYANVYYYQLGVPRSIKFYNNTITLRPVPDTQYKVELTGYLSPAAFLATTDRIKFGYMSEFIARGAARKIFADTGDRDQFQFNEPLYEEQKLLVLRRSDRQFTSVRVPTIYTSKNWVRGGNNWNNGLGIN